MGLAFKIEEMELEAETLRSMTLAVYTAIYEGTASYEEFNSAFNAVFRMAHDHMKHMKSLTDEAFALQRAGKAGGNDAKG